MAPLGILLGSIKFLVDIMTTEIALAFHESGSAQLGARSSLRLTSDRVGFWISAVMAFLEGLPLTR